LVQNSLNNKKLLIPQLFCCKYYLNCARNNISYFENYVEADTNLSQNQKNEIFALYQLCTLFVSWNAIKDKQIREIIDIRKSLFFR